MKDRILNRLLVFASWSDTGEYLKCRDMQSWNETLARYFFIGLKVLHVGLMNERRENHNSHHFFVGHNGKVKDQSYFMKLRESLKCQKHGNRYSIIYRI